MPRYNQGVLLLLIPLMGLAAHGLMENQTRECDKFQPAKNLELYKLKGIWGQVNVLSSPPTEIDSSNSSEHFLNPADAKWQFGVSENCTLFNVTNKQFKLYYKEPEDETPKISVFKQHPITKGRFHIETAGVTDSHANIVILATDNDKFMVWAVCEPQQENGTTFSHGGQIVSSIDVLTRSFSSLSSAEHEGLRSQVETMLNSTERLELLVALDPFHSSASKSAAFVANLLSIAFVFKYITNYV